MSRQTYTFSFYESVSKTYYANWWARLLDRKSTRIDLERRSVTFDTSIPHAELLRLLNDSPYQQLYLTLLLMGRNDVKHVQLEQGPPCSPYVAVTPTSFKSETGLDGVRLKAEISVAAPTNYFVNRSEQEG